MRKAFVTAAIFAVVLLLALQALSGEGPVGDREVRLAVVVAAILAVLILRRRPRPRRRRR
jgi:hypothetical protein